MHTLAHFSDPHLTSLADVDARALFDRRVLLNKRLFGYLSWRKRRRRVHRREVLDVVVADMASRAPDQILLSGDLTHVGMPAECDVAAHWLRSLAAPDRLRLVPGNHDRYVAADWHDTLGLWSDYLEPAGAPRWPRLWQCDEICVIGLDCAVPSGLFMATGTLGDAQIERLATMLKATAQKFRVLMLHHSPLPDGHAWRKRLTDASVLMRVIREFGAELIVHGHGHGEHFSVLPWRKGNCSVVAAPSASHAHDGRAGWNLFRIAKQGAHWAVSLEMRRRVDGRMQSTASHQWLTSADA